jgi:hypothetical protein
MNAPVWSNYLYLTHGTMTSDKIRFWARGGGEVNSVDIDVFNNGVWIDVYEGAFADKQWVMKTFTPGYCYPGPH